MKKPCLVSVGRIARTHGVRGDVKVYPYGDTLDSLSHGAKLLVRAPGKTGDSELTILEIRPQGRFRIARFRELSTIEDARKLAGSEVFITEDRLPPLEEGEFYHFQLIGLAVETRDGKKLGTLCGILETGGNDVYAVDCEGKEILIPAVEDVICEIDLAGRRMVVDLPEGLE